MGKTKLEHKIGFGGVPIGNAFETVSDQRAEETLQAAWEAGIRYFDTSPWYGLGLSERRFGHFLHNHPRDEYVLSTKVGRLLKATDKPPKTMWKNPSPFDYTYDYSASGVRRSIEDSLQRLGVERIDYVFIHDLSPDYSKDYEDGTTWLDQFEIARKGAMPELSKMRDEGLIKGWGFGVNTIEPILKTLEVADPDIFLSAVQYSLLRHKEALDKLFPAIEEHDVGLIAAAPFNSGYLAGKDHYNYSEEIPDEKAAKMEKLKAVTESHKVDSVAASLQFSAAGKAVDTVLFGSRKPEHVRENVKAFDTEIPPDFWAELKEENIIDERAAVPE